MKVFSKTLDEKIAEIEMKIKNGKAPHALKFVLKRLKAKRRDSQSAGPSDR